jgi:predicted Fe-Mo cluster-binding NifX family protein
MAETIADCEVLIAGGMGWGAYESLRASGIRPVVTDLTDIREAVLRLLRGELPDQMERLH